ncbi:MAG: peptide chain release factor N(5)-glutamine methyltransferase [Clostridia bacterium]|nr:peptide chain release factor N(5)-glutamine methyltransferase [Clostridia bacterium]
MVRKILNEAAKKLTNSPTPLLDARVLLSKALNCENALVVFRDLTDKEISTFNEYIVKRMQGIPVSYITGEKEFMGLNFILNNSTLIPRPDTECLVEKVIEHNNFSAPRILDLCTGSGCIGISLAYMIKNSSVELTDISLEALNAAIENINLHNLNSRVKAYKLDVISDAIENNYDIITANPPYIPTEVVKGLDVSRFEPVRALDGGADGLDFYRIIIEKAYYALNENGILALEIGYDQGESVPKLMNKFKSVYVYKDYGENDRVVIGMK